MAAENSLRHFPPATDRPDREPAVPMVDAVRKILAYLVRTGESAQLEAAVNLVEARLDQCSQESPLAENLRPWQLLASDLSLALEAQDARLSERARTVADGFRSIISMMYRNPADSLVLRPASRRVLTALAELGGRAPAEEVRAKSGHSVTHLSNILKALRGHGVVSEEALPGDRRRKVLQLTDAGRSMIAATGLRAEPAPAPASRFVSTIHVKREPTGNFQRYDGDLEVVRLQTEDRLGNVA